MEYLAKTEKYIAESFTRDGELSDRGKHSLNTKRWLLKIYPKADEIMQIAAVGHDIDSAFISYKYSGSFRDPEYLSLHQNNAADKIGEFLEKNGMSEDDIKLVKHLVDSHEVGGDDEQNIIKDADSLSFFDRDIQGFIDRHSRSGASLDDIREKFDWMYERITSDKARELARSMYEDALNILDKNELYYLTKWPNNKIEQHKITAKLCCKIMSETFNLMRRERNISEYDAQQFIVKKFTEYDLVSDDEPPIVAFRENTADIHHFPSKGTAKKLEPNSLIMVDLWARLNEPDAPFADITWMAWCGADVPDDIQKGFDVVVKSRDAGLDFLRGCLDESRGIKNKDLSDSMTKITLNSGMQDVIPHCFGHSLGFTSPHGKLEPVCDVSKNIFHSGVPYAIEPGIYVNGRYGFRSEVNCYINSDTSLEITTDLQTKLEII